MLIALVLVVTITGLTIGGQFSNDEDLRDESEKIRRALYFMSDEAALKNAVIRIHFMLDRAPQEYAVEYGPSDSFILPPDPELDGKVLTKEEEEKVTKAKKELNLKFNKIKEFQETNTEISDSVKILGIGTASAKALKTTGDVSIYAFPTGEKDDALIIVADEEAIISLEVDPFGQKVDSKVTRVEAVGSREINDVLNEKAKEIFETWLRDKK